jgi:hypothetical protein
MRWAVIQTLGALALAGGIYLEWGLAVALMIAGAGVLGGAVLLETLSTRPPKAEPAPELSERRERRMRVS